MPIWSALIGLAMTSQPKLLWQMPVTAGVPLEARVAGRFMYVAQSQAGVGIYRLNGDRPPRKVAQIGTAELGKSAAMNLRVVDESLYVALGDHFAVAGAKPGLAVVDVSRPERPKVVSVWVANERVRGTADVLVGEHRIYLAAMSAGVFEFARTDATQPSRYFQLDSNFPTRNPKGASVPNSRGLSMSGDRLFVADDSGGLRILDVQSGEEVGRYVNRTMLGKPQAYNSVVVRGDTAFVAVDYAGIEVLDVSDPAQIRQVSWWNPWRAGRDAGQWFTSSGHTNELALSADGRTLFASAGDSDLVVLDVSDPAKPVRLSGYGKPRDSSGAWGMTVDGGTAYLTYIKAVVPFRSTWSGIKAVKLNP